MDDRQILDVWGAGRRHPAARPLLMLAAARPDLPAEQLAALPVGRRNLLLLRDRQATFGDGVEGDVTCPACGERLELELRLAELIAAPEAVSAGSEGSEGSAVSGGSEVSDAAEGEVRAGDVVLRFRLPSPADLQAASSAPDAEAAAGVLLRRCVLSAVRNDRPVPVAELPVEVIDALDTALGQHDPHADLRLATACASCGHAFELVVDPGELYWAELAERAQRLLYQVHRLACAYGWTEGEILRLDPARREAYLELVG
jgi:hypothetical protein